MAVNPVEFTNLSNPANHNNNFDKIFSLVAEIKRLLYVHNQTITELSSFQAELTKLYDVYNNWHLSSDEKDRLKAKTIKLRDNQEPYHKESKAASDVGVASDQLSNLVRATYLNMLKDPQLTAETLARFRELGTSILSLGLDGNTKYTKYSQYSINQIRLDGNFTLQKRKYKATYNLGLTAQSDDDFTLAVLFDNPTAISCLLNEATLTQTAKSAGDIIQEKNLLSTAISNGSIALVRYFVETGTPLEVKTKVESGTQGHMDCTFFLTPLGMAIRAMNSGMNVKIGAEIIKVLLEAGAHYNCKARKSWNETRGYYTNQKMITMKEDVSLFDFDTTGVFAKCVNEFRQFKRAEQSAKKGKNRRKGPSESNLQQRVTALERENVAMKSRIADLERIISRLQANTRATTITTTTDPTAIQTHRAPRNDSRAICRFFNPAISNSCRNGNDCNFVHDRGEGRTLDSKTVS